MENCKVTVVVVERVKVKNMAMIFNNNSKGRTRIDGKGGNKENLRMR